MFDLMLDHFAKSKKIIQRERERERAIIIYHYLLKLVLDGIKESKKPLDPIAFHILKKI